ncbi:MAG: triose-phosphate isomerase, partial [Alistipes sp.]|nr:triose-phosphate isomerase [Alistipes sp.]
MRKKIVAGNWKMNTLPQEGVELAKGVAAGRGEVCDCVVVILCTPFTHIAQVVEAVDGKGVAVGAQDCATEVKGSYTGEVS